ncbi:MAG: hypothetical protein H0X67_12075 [Acidobacteria bacterium]|nr:hypothetical protein [Acidobacteriota bacterium]
MFTRQAVALVAALALASASLLADVTIVTTMTMDGGAPGMMAGQQMPRLVTHVKGMKAATVVETGATTMTSIIDLTRRRVVMLNSQDRTAQVLDGTPAAADKSIPIPKMDLKVTPTGRKRTIQGVECTEHTYTMTVQMDQVMGGGQVPPEAAAMLQGVSMKMDGSVWSATTGPGAAEFMAYTKAFVDQNMMAVMASGMPGLAGGIDQMMAASTQAPGIAYLTEMTMTVEGTGQVVEMMRKMGPMKMRMEVTSISTDSVPDSMFEIPQGYKTVK